MRFIVLVIGLLMSGLSSLQAQVFYNRQDSLRGYLFPERACYDVKYYGLAVEFERIDPTNDSLPLNQLTGAVDFLVQNEAAYSRLQIDLFERFAIDSILWQNQKLRFDREGNATFVHFPEIQLAGALNRFKVFYHGTALVAKRAPWDGGFSFAVDSSGKPWVGVSCEGLGASSWWPNKDHLSEEPDSMTMSYTVPKGLMAVGNGKLVSRVIKDEKETFTWRIDNPINNYNVTVNIADYAHFSDDYTDVGGELRTLNYYVLRGNESKAVEHFQQVKPMLSCFEAKMGPYPFWEDGYALVETPYWGMEHQSAIAYGNNYKNNKYGFDFIIVHESGHEWFGNSISVTDHADMWIHEGFCTYSEVIYVECMQGKERAYDYINEQRKSVLNKKPMVGPYAVNYTNGDLDNYKKGAWIIHTLRNSLNDDTRFYELMRAFNRDFFKKSTNTNEVVTWWATNTNARYEPTLKHYLHRPELPVLEFKIEGKGKKTKISYRYSAVENDFYLPLVIQTASGFVSLNPGLEWQEMPLPLQKDEVLKLPFSDYLLQLKAVN